MKHFPFELVPKRTPREPAIFLYEENNLKKTCKGKQDWVLNMGATVARAGVQIKKAKYGYKSDF